MIQQSGTKDRLIFYLFWKVGNPILMSSCSFITTATRSSDQLHQCQGLAKRNESSTFLKLPFYFSWHTATQGAASNYRQGDIMTYLLDRPHVIRRTRKEGRKEVNKYKNQWLSKQIQSLVMAECFLLLFFLNFFNIYTTFIM